MVGKHLHQRSSLYGHSPSVPHHCIQPLSYFGLFFYSIARSLGVYDATKQEPKDSPRKTGTASTFRVPGNKPADKNK